MKHVHIHVDCHNEEEEDLLQQILTKLQVQETIMTALSDAVQALTDTLGTVVARIDEDVAHLLELLAQAQANDATDAAAIAELQSDADATVARITEATATLSAIDPVASFPEVVEPTP